MLAAQPQTAPRDRLVLLCREYEANNETIVIPLTRAELADRWGVSRGTVQRFLTRRMASGEVVATTPLTLNAAAIVGDERPRLQLLVNRPGSDIDNDSAGSELAAGASTVGIEAWLGFVHDALVAAAAAGQTETTLALEGRLYERLASHQLVSAAPADAVRDRRATSGALLRDLRATSSMTRVAHTSSDQELERIPSHSQDLEAARPVAQPGRATVAHDAHEALKSANAPDDVIAVVLRRLSNGHLRSTGATPAWTRTPQWQAPAWSEEDGTDLQRWWSETFDRPLTGDALLALQLWTPDQAKDAIFILGEDDNIRSPLGRILEAAVWGYHKYFPPLGDTPDRSVPTAKRLWELSEAEARFAGDPDLVVEHLRTLAAHSHRNEEELLDILGIHALKGHLTVAELEVLDWHRWTSAEIAAAADRVERALTGDRP